MKTAILMAMHEEAKPVIEDFGMTPYSIGASKPWNKPVYHSEKHEGLFLVLNGSDKERPEISKVGTQAAAVSAYLAIEQLGVEHIINAGTAGGFESRSTKVGDVFLCKTAFYHDRRVPITSDWDEFAKGSYSLNFNSEWLEKYELKEGIVSTGNALDYVEKDLELLHSYGAHVKEMEAAAIAEICKEVDIPLTVIKSITDIVDGGRPTQEEFLENLSLASNRLSEKLLAILHSEF